MKTLRATTLAALPFLAAALLIPARADAPPAPSSPASSSPAGMTMRIRREIVLNGQKATNDFRAFFLPPDRFRVEGVTRFKNDEVKVTVVGNGSVVKQLAVAPTKTVGYTVDLVRVRNSPLGAGYSPEKTYDPAVYNEMVKSAADKKILPDETLDGVETHGYELPLPKGRLSLPSNAPILLPNPAALRVWIAPKDGLARKVELQDAQGRTFLTMLYTDVKTGAAISPDTFNFDFTPGVAPDDITDVILAGLKAAEEPPQPNAQAVQPKETAP